jgi:regulatory protein YycH of two-component signal transduction system YycFG
MVKSKIYYININKYHKSQLKHIISISIIFSNCMPINSFVSLLPILNALKDDHFTSFNVEVEDST